MVTFRRRVKSPEVAETTFTMSTIEEEMEGVGFIIVIVIIVIVIIVKVKLLSKSSHIFTFLNNVKNYHNDMITFAGQHKTRERAMKFFTIWMINTDQR